jgi:hypothetical protein
VQPAKLVFDKAAPGADVGSLEVSGGKVTEVRTSNPSLVAALEPLEGGRYRVRVKLAGNAKPGRLLGKLIVKTADAAQPEITVPVLGLVR